MLWQLILGLFLLVYGIFVFYIALTKKPDKIWNMGKIQGFVKILGEKGTVIFFIVWGVIALAVGIYLLTLYF